MGTRVRKTQARAISTRWKPGTALESVPAPAGRWTVQQEGLNIIAHGSGSDYEQVVDILADMVLAWEKARRNRALESQTFLSRILGQLDRENEEEAEKEWLTRKLGTEHFQRVA